jgi:hypothetical protein
MSAPIHVTWNQETSVYETVAASDGTRTTLTENQVIALRTKGTEVRCYGGPLDRLRPTRLL